MRKFVEADLELAEHFTTAIGVRAQGYEPHVSGVQFDFEAQHLVHRRALSRIRNVETSLSNMENETKRVLEVVYTPHGSPGLLAIALQPQWGGGSFVRLAVEMPRAIKAFEKRYPKDTSASVRVLQFLADEAGRGVETRSFFQRLVSDCEYPRGFALGVYDKLRTKRIDRLTAEREQWEKDILSGAA